MTAAAKPNPIPGSYRRVTPCLVVQGAAKALDLYADVFGATMRRAPQDQLYGYRDGFIVDPFGHGWTIATHVEDVSPQELTRRMAALFGQSPAKE